MAGALVVPSKEDQINEEKEFTSSRKPGFWLEKKGNMSVKNICTVGWITPGPPDTPLPLIRSLFCHPVVAVLRNETGTPPANPRSWTINTKSGCTEARCTA